MNEICFWGEVGHSSKPKTEHQASANFKSKAGIPEEGEARTVELKKEASWRESTRSPESMVVIGGPFRQTTTDGAGAFTRTIPTRQEEKMLMISINDL